MKKESTGIDTIQTLTETMANSYVTYLQCGGHHKAAMNEGRVKDCAEALANLNVEPINLDALKLIGEFNGEGAY